MPVAEAAVTGGSAHDVDPRAVAAVMRAQPPETQAAIVRAAQANPGHPAAQALGRIGALSGAATVRGQQETGATGKAGGTDLLGEIGHLAGGALHGIEAGAGAALHGAESAARAVESGIQTGVADTGKGLGALTHFLFTPPSAPVDPVQRYAVAAEHNQAPGALQAGLPVPLTKALQIGDNTVKDLWELPGGTVQSTYELGKNIFEGKFGKAAAQFYDPYIHLFQDPNQAIEHPLLTYMMLRGGGHIADRLLGKAAPAFSDSAKELMARQRAPEHIGTVGGAPSPILDYGAPYAKGYLARRAQVWNEDRLAAKGFNPNQAGVRAPFVLNLDSHNAFRERRIANEEVAAQQATAKGERLHVQAKISKAIKDNPGPDEGLGAVTHVLQGVLRTPQTAAEDAAKYIKMLNDNRPEDGSEAALWNRTQVRDLTHAINTPGALDRAFAVAKDIRPIIHAQDAARIAKGHIDAHQALRASLIPYAQMHMGARYDPGGDLTEAAARYKEASRTADVARREVAKASSALSSKRAARNLAWVKANMERGPGRGVSRPDRTGEPLPANLYEVLDGHQRRLAAANDRVIAAVDGGREAQHELEAAHENHAREKAAHASLMAQLNERLGPGRNGHQNDLRSLRLSKALAKRVDRQKVKLGAAEDRLTRAQLAHRESVRETALARRDRELKQRQHDQAFREAQRRLGPVGQQDLRDQPLPKALYEQLTRHDSKVADAEGRLAAAKATRDSALAAKKALAAHRGDVIEPRFVREDGSELSTQDILDHLEAHNVAQPAYIEHTVNKQDNSNFFKAYRGGRGAPESTRRTGKAFESGFYDHTLKGLSGQMSRRAQLISRTTLHDRIISRAGIRKPKELRIGEAKAFQERFNAGKLKMTPAQFDAQKARILEGYFRNPAEARAFAYKAAHDSNGNKIPGALNLVPINASPKIADLISHIEDLQNPRELENVGDLELKQLHRAMHGDEAGPTSAGDYSTLLVPKELVNEIEAHFRGQNEFMKILGRFTQKFKGAVLPLSTHWMTQILTETGMRGLLAGVFDPRSIHAGRQLQRELAKTEAGRRAAVEINGASFFHGKVDPMLIHYNPTKLGALFERAPVTRQLILMHRAYAQGVGQFVHWFESQGRLAQMGKDAREELHNFAHQYQAAITDQGNAMAALAAHLEQTPELVARFGRSVDKTFGNYTKMRPALRQATQTAMPFLPWSLNAARFVFHTLPFEHPVAAAVQASLLQALNQDMQDGKGAPLNAWGMQEVGRLSPFGIHVPTDYQPSWDGVSEDVSDWAGTLMPQFISPMYALTGTTGKGPLKGPNGDVKARSGDALAAAFENMAESMIPGLRYARIALSDGKKTFQTSTLWNPQDKPGTNNGGPAAIVRRLLDPFYGAEQAQGNANAPAWGPAPKSKGGIQIPTVNIPTVNIPTVNIPTVNIPSVG